MRQVAGVPPSPIVPAAILYDLDNGGDKAWGEKPPYRALGMEAVRQAGRSVTLGTIGAGYGAMAGRLKGGIGTASWTTGDGLTVGAIVATNSLGSVTLPNEKRFWAAPYEQGSEFGGLGVSSSRIAPEDWSGTKLDPKPRANTTLACIATDAALTQDELKRIAMMAQDGLARAIHPVHSPFDGDTIFSLATGRKTVPAEGRALLVARLGSIAADVLARAVARGVYSATQPPRHVGPSLVRPAGCALGFALTLDHPVTQKRKPVQAMCDASARQRREDGVCPDLSDERLHEYSQSLIRTPDYCAYEKI